MVVTSKSREGIESVRYFIRDSSNHERIFHWSQMFFEMDFFSGCFTHMMKRKWLYDDEFRIVWWVNLCHRRSWFTVFASLLSFTLSNKMQSKIVYREEFNRCNSITRITFASNLNLLRNLHFHPHQEMFIVMWSLFWIKWINQTNSVWNCLKKKSFIKASGINSIQYLYLVIDMHHIILVNALVLFSRVGQRKFFL